MDIIWLKLRKSEGRGDEFRNLIKIVTFSDILVNFEVINISSGKSLYITRLKLLFSIAEDSTLFGPMALSISFDLCFGRFESSSALA